MIMNEWSYDGPLYNRYALRSWSCPIREGDRMVGQTSGPDPVAVEIDARRIVNSLNLTNSDGDDEDDE